MYMLALILPGGFLISVDRKLIGKGRRGQGTGKGGENKTLLNGIKNEMFGTSRLC